MRYTIPIHEFSFNKIKSGSRKINIHLFDKKAQQVKIRDILEMQNAATGEQIDCEVTGIAIFDNFSDLIDALTPQALGYNSKKEITVRLDRIFPQEAQQALNAVAFFIKPQLERLNHKFRQEMERE